MRISVHPDHNHVFPSPEALSATLSEALPGFGSVQWVSSTGSTNADLTQRARHLTRDARDIHATAMPHPPRPWLLGAHLQTAGKGRAGRPWNNEAGSTLMFSCAFETTIPLAQLPGIAPALGVTTCLALRSFIAAHSADAELQHLKQHLSQHLTLKWPNDLEWHGAKLAGLLIETAPASTVVIGMGLNLKGADQLSAQLDRAIADLSQIQAMTDQADISSVHFSPAPLVAHLAQAWQQALKDYADHGYSVFKPSFDIVDALAGQTVHVMDQGKILYQGLAQGTDELGRLRVMTQTGVIPVVVGDISIRPMNALKAKGAP
jgi:BirA family transcriptional regulator, biotin operon repressor / biotin---[acetyl-CoA-carboxylase] ligase